MAGVSIGSAVREQGEELVKQAGLRTELQALELRLRAELEQRLNRQKMQLAVLFVAALGVALAILK